MSALTARFQVGTISRHFDGYATPTAGDEPGAAWPLFTTKPRRPARHTSHNSHALGWCQPLPYHELVPGPDKEGLRASTRASQQMSHAVFLKVTS